MTDRRWDTERQEWVYPADWRPVASAPKAEPVLVYEHPVIYIASWTGEGLGQFWSADHGYDDGRANPTHWLPLAGRAK